MKQCKTCGDWKELEDFYPHATSKDGVLGKCKECCRMAQKEYRQDNGDSVRAYDRERGQRQSSEERRRYGQMTGYRIQKEWQAKNPEKRKAHHAVSNAIRDGKLIKPDRCSVCGKICSSRQLQGHHHDYSKPLDVTWVCKSCHAREHRK